jgi:hypothetical protein
MTPEQLEQLAEDAWRDAVALLRAARARDPEAVRVVRENLAEAGLTAVILANLLNAAVAEDNPAGLVEAWLRTAEL